MVRKRRVSVAAAAEQIPEGNSGVQSSISSRAYPTLEERLADSPSKVAEPDNLVLELLRAIRANLGDHGQRLGRIEMRLSVIEQTLGSLYAMGGSDREAMEALVRRVERIERRLDLAE